MRRRLQLYVSRLFVEPAQSTRNSGEKNAEGSKREKNIPAIIQGEGNKHGITAGGKKSWTKAGKHQGL